MNIKTIIRASILAAFALVASNAMANSIDADQARAAANKFLQSRSAKGKFNSPSGVRLVHTEKSNVSDNAYYVFNADGGGWVIIAGDDRAKVVLAYGDKGNIDMNKLPGGMMGFLNNYKKQIETAQAFTGKIVPKKTYTRSTVVSPLLKSNWGQDEPMNRYCPMNGTERTSVGCGPLAMAQIMYYWKYPESSKAMSGYYVMSGCGPVPALDATTFDYNKILVDYTIYNPETGGLSYVDYTDEQANEVAKLCRYSGHACKAQYGDSEVTGTGSYPYDQLAAFKFFGFNSGAQLIGKDPYSHCDNYPTKYTYDEWAALIYTELEAGRPIPYHDLYEGHAWVLDGVDAEGRFHMNWGFNGAFNGWFEINSLAFHPFGNATVWDFSQGSNGGNEMIIGMYPYDGYVIPGDDPSVTIGDVNRDGEVNITDAIDLINYVLNDEGDIDLIAADCHHDGEVNITDAIDLINYVLNDAW